MMLKITSAGDTNLILQSANPGSTSLDFYEGTGEKAHITFDTVNNVLTMGRAAGGLSIDNSGNSTFAGAVTISGVNDTYNFKALATDTDSWFGVYEDANNSVNIILTRSDSAEMFKILGHTGAATFAGSINGGDINLSSTNNAIIDPLSVGNILRFTDNDPTQNNNQITGTIEWETKDSNNPGIQSFITTNSTNQGKGRLVFGTGLGGSAVEKMRIDSDGNVGIGTASPTAKLQVSGKSFFTNDIFTLQNKGIFFNGLDDFSSGIASIDSGTSVRIFAGGSEKVRVKSTGNVGIGTTGPQSKLQVAGGIQMADDTATASATKVGTMRYRTGTEYVEVTGTELVTNGDFATDSDWTKGAGWTISGGKANGASTGLSVTQTISIPINKTYRVKYTISNYSAGVFRIILGSYVAGTNRSANGTYTDILTVSNASSNSLLYLTGDISAFTGSVDNVSVIEVTAEDASYADMCMQTGSSTYEWVNIVRNTY